MMNPEILEKLAPITDEERRILGGNGSIDRSLYMDGSTDIIDRKKLLSKGKLITVRPHPRFVHFPEHTHNYVEAIYMCSGQTTHLINGEQVLLKEGELMFLSQNTVQEILPASKGDVAVNFIILPEFFDNAILMLGDEETPLRRFIISCMKNNGGAGYLRFAVADVLPVQNLIENLIWTLIHDVSNKRKINQFTMGLLLLQLMNYTEHLVYEDTQEEAVIQALRYIEEHYRDGSLKELSENLHYDFTWYSREIKKKTGETYISLVQKKRLSQACFLLRNTDMNIIDISMQVGYDNISYFHRLFQRTFNMSPRQYRILGE